MHDEITCAIDARSSLGEGPIWSSIENSLYWVDIKGHNIHRFHPDSQCLDSCDLAADIGFVALRAGGGLLAAQVSRVVKIDFPAGHQQDFVQLDEPDGNRINDSKCDRFGRLWVGTMDNGETKAAGALYRIDQDGTVARILSGFVIVNGIAWSPDSTLMYVTDTVSRRIDMFDFDFAAGTLSNRRVFATIDAEAGWPDGLTVDSEGGVWSAHWDGWRVTRYAPDGTVDRIFPVPVPRPTSCTFGGDRLEMLFVTSARIGLDAAALTRAPLSGGVFSCHPGVVGLPEPMFGMQE